MNNSYNIYSFLSKIDIHNEEYHKPYKELLGEGVNKFLHRVSKCIELDFDVTNTESNASTPLHLCNLFMDNKPMFTSDSCILKEFNRNGKVTSFLFFDLNENLVFNNEDDKTSITDAMINVAVNNGINTLFKAVVLKDQNSTKVEEIELLPCQVIVPLNAIVFISNKTFCYE